MRPGLAPTHWLRNEAILGLDPAPGHIHPDEWRRRLLAFPGRSLSADVLIAEQRQRAGRLAARGQMLTPGVVLGLAVRVASDGTTESVHITPGYGLAITGEDVSLARELVLPIADITVLDDPPHTPTTPTPGEVSDIPSEVSGIQPDPVVATANKAYVLVLRPIEIQTREEDRVGDPCENDPARDAFADLQRIDGAMPVWVPMTGRLANIMTLFPAAERRNYLAYELFRFEIEYGKSTDNPPPTHPWLEHGVPLALVGFDADGRVAFVDRHAVVRHGGKAPPRSPFLRASMSKYFDGTPTLWQARLEQFGEHLADHLDRVVDPAALQAAFTHLPPAGLLPLALLEDLPAPTRRQKLFPAHATVEWEPIRSDELDARVTRSMSLAPILAARPFVVRILVPVPAHLFEPRLLVTDQPNTALLHKQAELTVARNTAASARAKLVDDHDAIKAILNGPLPDPTTPQELKTVLARCEALSTAKTDKRVLQSVSAVLAKKGLHGARQYLADLADRADDRIDFGFLKVQTDMLRARAVLSGEDTAQRLGTSRALAGIAGQVGSDAGPRDLERFFANVTKPTTPIATAINIPHGFQPFLRRDLVEALARTPTLEHILGDGPSGTARSARMTVPTARTARTESPAAEIRERLRTPPEFDSPALERTVTIGERLTEPPASLVRNAALSTKYTVLRDIQTLASELDLGDVKVTLPHTTNKRTISSTVDLATVTTSTTDLGNDESKIDSDVFSDQARAVNSGVRMLDETIYMLRQVVVRTADLRQLIEFVDQRIAELAERLGELATKLASADQDLAEVAHDLAVADALVAEDTAVVAAVNERRRGILATHVAVAAYVRPRSVDVHDALPTRELEAPEEMPVPACFREPTGPVPPEIRKAIDLVRRAPIRWLPPHHALVDALDDRPILAQAVQATVLLAPLTMKVAVASRVKPEALPLVRGLDAGFAAMAAQLEERDEAIKTFDVERAPTLAWRDLRDRALDVMSLADFVHIAHVRPLVLQLASQAVDGMTRVAMCLYRRFADVPADTRLAWVQKLSVHDTAVGLRDLMALPKFSNLPAADRDGMQELVDWLFTQVAAAPRPRAMMDNLVRVLILVASHAPVNALLRGTIRSTTVTIGHLLAIEAPDTATLHIGMNVLLKATHADRVQHVRAVVENITDAHAHARVFATSAATVDLPDDTEVLLGDIESLTAGINRILAPR